MPSLHTIAAQKLQLLEAKHQRRTLRIYTPKAGAYVHMEGRDYISFSSNDYLGLSHHPEVIEAARAALEKYGTGAGASRLITGNHPLYDELETLLAQMHGTQSACVFGSGYMASIGVIPALVQHADVIVADKLIHACMLDAAKLSGATLYRYAHNNLNHCREILKAHRAEHANCLLLSESIFSMDGDRAPVPELSALAREYDAWLMVDTAHSIQHSASGAQGLGDVILGTLSKAAGSYGGYICADKAVTDYLKSAARSLIFSTALPPATLAASIASLRIMERETELCVKPLTYAKMFTGMLGLPEAQSAIVPLIVGQSESALKASQALAVRGFLVHAIRPPTVPPDTARLRITFSALHEQSHVEALAEAVREEVLCAPLL